MRLETPVVRATLLLLTSITVYACSGGGGGGTVASDEPIPVENTRPVAEFSATPISGSAPLRVEFQNQSDVGGELLFSFIWLFGDGGSTVEISPTHTYQLPGTYTVTLRVTTALGVSTKVESHLIFVLPSGPPPFPNFSADPTTGPVSLDVQFTNRSGLGGQPFATFSWDFGDGQTGTERDPFHTYTDVGVYTVSLTVTTAGGTAIETKTDFIHVLTFVPPPVADFSATPRVGKPPLDVQFSNLSDLNGAESATYLWDFGDGQSSTEQHPPHTYGALGLYTVSLTTTTRGGFDTDTRRNFIHVRFAPPFVDFSATPDSGDPLLHVQFTDMSDLKGAPGATYLWDFDDGTTSTEQNPVHDFSIEGFFRVFLTVSTSGGTDSTFRTISVGNQTSRHFLLTFEENHPGSLTPIELSIYISADVRTSGSVDIPGLALVQPFSVVPGTVTEVSIPIGAMTLGNDIATANGIVVSALDPINVYGLNRRVWSTDGFVVFPIETLGTEYFVMSMSASSIIDSSQIAIVAREDNTTIQITPTASTGTRVVGVPYTVMLNWPEVYQLQTDGFLEDLTGTHIVSDKPIAVFSGNTCATVPTGSHACDHLAEQLPSITTWGTELITVPLATRSGGDTFRVLAAQDNTTVTIEGASPDTIVLNAGQFAERLLEGVSRISADRPILAAQFSNSFGFDRVLGERADPFMMILMPEERFLSSYSFATPSFDPLFSDFSINYVNIVASRTNVTEAQVLLDGIALDPRLFTRVIGAPFSSAQVPVARGSHTVTAPNPFGLYIYGFTKWESYGYPGGMAF